MNVSPSDLSLRSSETDKGGWLKLVSVTVETLPVGTKPPAAVGERISPRMGDTTRMRHRRTRSRHIPAREGGRFGLHTETGGVGV